MRSPVSRSSRATIAALARQLTAMACSRAWPAGEQVAPVGVEPFEEVGVAEQAVFHHLGIAGAELALRQRVEQRGVGHHQDRLIERADQVLAVAGVDRGLAADGRIDLGEQRRRHLHVVDAAAHDRRRQTRRDRRPRRRRAPPRYRRARSWPRAVRRKHAQACGSSCCSRRPAPSTRRDADAGARKRCFRRREMMARHRLVGDDRDLASRPELGDSLAERRDQAAADRRCHRRGRRARH